MRFTLYLTLLCCLACSLHSQNQTFDPITETSYYTVYAFKIDSAWAVFVGLDTTGWNTIVIPDTVEVHWMQPKYRTPDVAKPYFCKHVDTLSFVIPNSESLYRYKSTGDDSVVFAPVSLDGVTSGLWEFSVTTTDTSNLTSQFAEPFNCKIAETLYPAQAVQFKLILRRQ